MVKNYFIWLGLIIAILGFLYDVFYGGIPYQDAPAALLEEYIHNQNISKAIIAIGLLLTAVE